MVSKHWKKAFTALVVAIAMVLSTATAVFATGTKAGVDILSTNTVLIYSNLSGGVWTTTGSNTVTNTVDQILGATNITITWFSNTFGAGTTNVYTFTFTNMANTNAQFRFTMGSNFANLGASSTWYLKLSNAEGAGALINNNDTVARTNDEQFIAYLHYGIPADAPDGATLTFMLTNELLYAGGGLANSSFYQGSNSFWYGGTNWLTNAFQIRVGGPKVTLAKAATVVDFTNGSVVLPGSIITYTLTYTNSGSASASNVTLRDYLPTQVAYYTNTSTTVSGSNATITLLTSGGATEPPANFTTGTVNTAVDSIRFLIPIVPAGEGGVLRYKVVVK